MVIQSLPQGWSIPSDSIPMIMRLEGIASIWRKTVFLLLVWIAISGILPHQSHAEAMQASPHPFVVTQDGEDLILKIKGDEFQHWVTDEKDYTVIRNEEGYYMYADLSPDKKRLVSTAEKVGRHATKHPKSKNLRPEKRDKDGDQNHGITFDGGPAVTTPRKSKWPKRCHRGGIDCGLRNAKRTEKKDDADTVVLETVYDHHRRMISMPAVGTLKNLVVLLMFSDHQDREVPSKEDIHILMNNEVVDEARAPTGSLKMLYWENSYGQLTIESEVTDWIVLSNTEKYYAGGESGLGWNRIFHRALREALTKLDDDDFAFETFDLDMDGRIDSITFLTSSFGAEWGGIGYEDRIWSHKWSISGGWESQKGTLITDYHVSPSLWGTSGHQIGRVGVIGHETGHFLKLPDLYDTDGSGAGLGYFGLMANSWGFDGSQLHPPQMSAWSKLQLGWTQPKTPSVGVENRVAQSEVKATAEAPHQLYKVGDDEYGFPPGEYFLIEFRKTSWLEGGIAIFHIDEKIDSYNREGYPGQAGEIMWPMNGNHYKIALTAADGLFELEKDFNRGNSNDLYGIGQSLLPSNSNYGPFPNTDTYQDGKIERTGVRICVTSGSEGSYMTFLFADDNPAQPWMVLVNEDFEMEVSEAVSFGTNATLLQHQVCEGSSCAKIKNQGGTGMSVRVSITRLAELMVAFEFFSLAFVKGEELIVEYSVNDGADDSWINLETWTKGADEPFGFVNKKWYTASVHLSLENIEVPSTEEAYITIRFRSTAERKNIARIFVDNVKIDGLF